jgi:OmpA-OmpF porin, OOP family
MKKEIVMGAVFLSLGLYGVRAHADANGNQPETPAGMNQAPIAGSPVPVNAGAIPTLEVEFQADHSDVPPTFSRTIEPFGKFLQAHSQSRVEIVAYADHTGHAPANGQLAQKRADAVAKYLETNYGIAPNRIKAQGYGEVPDKAHNSTEAARQASRRAYGKIIGG